MILTENFYLEEFLKNNYKIELQPTKFEITNLKKLCENVLQPLRDKFETPIQVTSGLRNVVLNSQIKGSSKYSHHLSGFAADIQVTHPITLVRMLCHIIKNLEFTQCIYYIREEKKNWIHVSFVEGSLRKDVKFKECGSYYSLERFLKLAIG